jgi:hypothetical protein
MNQKGMLAYTLKRLALFGVTLAVGYALGLRELWLIVIALLVSGAVSLVLLNRDRDGASAQAVSLAQRLNRRISESAAKEDAAIDSAAAQELDFSRQNRETKG